MLSKTRWRLASIFALTGIAAASLIACTQHEEENGCLAGLPLKELDPDAWDQAMACHVSQDALHVWRTQGGFCRSSVWRWEQDVFGFPVQEKAWSSLGRIPAWYIHGAGGRMEFHRDTPCNKHRLVWNPDFVGMVDLNTHNVIDFIPVSYKEAVVLTGLFPMLGVGGESGAVYAVRRSGDEWAVERIACLSGRPTAATGFWRENEPVFAAYIHGRVQMFDFDGILGEAACYEPEAKN